MYINKEYTFLKNFHYMSYIYIPYLIMRGFCSDFALPHTYNLNISPFSTEIDLQYDDHRHWSQNVWMVMVSENNPVRGEAIISFGGNNQRYIYLISSNFLELLFSALWTNLNQKDAMYIGDTPKCKNFENPIRSFHQYQNSWNFSLWFAQYILGTFLI